MQRDWLIIGGGFRGLVAAHLFRSAGKSVKLIERRKDLGGVLNSRPWRDIYLDYGCHVFDNNDDALSKIVFDLGGRNGFEPVQVRYAMRLRGAQSDGIAVPDFSRLPPAERAQILYELLEAATDPEAETRAASLNARCEARWGPTIARHLREACAKIFQADPERLAASALAQGPFDRLRVAPDAIGEVLKQSPILDARVAVSTAENPTRFYDQARAYPHRNFYPSAGGMRGFVTRAQAQLAQSGVEISPELDVVSLRNAGGGVDVTFSDGSVETYGQVLLTTGLPQLEQLVRGDETISALMHPTAMVLYYFFAPVDAFTGMTYVHSFEPDEVIYRASAPGFYGRQTTADGLTYAVCEIPTTIGSALWEDPAAAADRVWAEMSAMGIVDAPAYAEAEFIKAPVTYTAALVGFEEAREALLAEAAERLPRLQITDPLAFTKNSIVEDLRRIEKEGAA